MHNRYQQRRRCCSGGPEEKQPPPKPAAQEQCHRKERSAPPAPPPKGPSEHAVQYKGGSARDGLRLPFLNGILSGNSSGDLMALMILLLLLWEGKEDSRGTVLTLLIFLLL